MPIKNPEEQVAYLLAIIRSCPEFKADYHMVVADTNISNANLAQKNFKSIVEASGKYRLVDGKVVENFNIAKPGAATDDPADTTGAVTRAKAPNTPRKRKAAATTAFTTDVPTQAAEAAPANTRAKRSRKKAPTVAAPSAVPAPVVETDDAQDTKQGDDAMVDAGTALAGGLAKREENVDEEYCTCAPN